jgi:hypothetical protein
MRRKKMNIDFQIEFFSRSEKEGNLCFMHAVKRAINGEFIDMEVDDFSGRMSHTSCIDCREEQQKEREEED